jgi:predicted nucleotide-binding protein
MPSKRPGASEPLNRRPLQLCVPRDEAKEKLEKQIAEGEGMLGLAAFDPSFRTRKKLWTDFNKELLRSLFTTDELAQEYATRGPRILRTDETQTERWNRSMQEIQRDLDVLRSVARRLELYPVVGGAAAERSKGPVELTGDVFLVHGHDSGTKETVARFLERLGLNVVILHEQPGQGRTVIEKFEDHAATAAFAVVLLTPDDVGGGSTGKLLPRARQNVVLELGYFLGALGRKRVCALRAEDVEEPSDLRGVLYIPIDTEGGWRLRLGSELKAAGLDVDLNDAV